MCFENLGYWYTFPDENNSVLAIYITNIVLGFINQLNILTPLRFRMEENSLTQQLSTKNRKELQTKMASVFHKDTKGLSAELQETLLDDMVTAFVNRIVVFKRV